MLRTNPATTLWITHSEGRTVECVTRFVPNGVEVEIVSDGSPLYSRVFAEGGEALAWAEEERLLRLPHATSGLASG